MPRVLLTGFCAVPGPRRAGVQLRHVIRSLSAIHTVDLLVVREGEQAYVERQGSVRMLRVPTHEGDLRSQIQSFQRALKRQLDGADYDVVHCRDAWSGIPVLEARARLGFAVVYDLTRSPLGETTFDSELDAQYAQDEEACLQASDLVLAPTPAAMRALQRHGRPERVMLSPPGVDVDRFDWEDSPASSSPRILYAGSIDPGRGVRVLVRAMTSVVQEVDARLVLAGTMAPKFDLALREGIRELGLADKVEVLGPVDHDRLPMLIATATVCIVPSAPDLAPSPTVVYPTKLLEYMACRRAIVAPRRETVAQVVENNREALLFEPGDPVDLARKVLRLLGEPALRDRLAQNAYERVRRDFTASAARRALRSAYGVLTERFREQLVGQIRVESPKVEMLSDDDFEATVFEEAPSAPPVDTVSKLHVLEVGDDSAGSTGSAVVAAPRRDRAVTIERSVASSSESGAWTASVEVRRAPPAGVDDWVVAHVGTAGRAIDGQDGEGTANDTPIEGVVAVAPVLPTSETMFISGEIDVPTPPPMRIARSFEELTTASTVSRPSSESQDVDTSTRTPPIERR